MKNKAPKPLADADATPVAPAPMRPAASPADPQVGGRFERLPDGTLRPVDPSASSTQSE